ncbi:MAG: hypothetical protein EOM67_11105 [Spirochaetia bacterium]|nr:hypothetical protein [Spirochaetia bacterium]
MLRGANSIDITSPCGELVSKLLTLFSKVTEKDYPAILEKGIEFLNANKADLKKLFDAKMYSRDTTKHTIAGVTINNAHTSTSVPSSVISACYATKGFDIKAVYLNDAKDLDKHIEALKKAAEKYAPLVEKLKANLENQNMLNTLRQKFQTC